MRQGYILFLILISQVAFGQEKTDKEKLIEAKGSLKEGNTFFKEGKYDDAIASYEKSLKSNTTYYKGAYNLGNTLFKQQKFKEAGDQFALANKLAKTKEEKSRTKELMGDAFIAQKDLENAEKSYKEALLKNPKDDVLRQKYIATKQAKQQQDDQKKQDDKNKDENKDNKDQQDQKDKGDNKDDQNKDNKGDQDKKDQNGDNKEDNKDGENKENEDKKNKEDKGKDQKDKDGDKEKDNKDKQDKGDQNKDQQKGENEKEQQGGAKPQPSKLSPEQIQQLLESMGNEEEKTQKKVNAQQVKVKGKKNEKDW